MSNRLTDVKTVIQYWGIHLSGQTTAELVDIFRKTKTDIVYGAHFWWGPFCESPASYGKLKNMVSEIKVKLPNIKLIEAIPTQRLLKIDYNEETCKKYSEADTWTMAVNPTKWGIKKTDGTPYTKEDFHKKYGYYAGSGKDAFFGDLTNPIFQEILMGRAKKMIAAYMDGFWLDLLWAQARCLYEITRDENHISVRESLKAGNELSNKIKNLPGNPYVGTWIPPDYLKTSADFDFLVESPSVCEVLCKKLDDTRWNTYRQRIDKLIGKDIPVWIFFDNQTSGIGPTSVMAMYNGCIWTRKPFQLNLFKEFRNYLFGKGMTFVFPIYGGRVVPHVIKSCGGCDGIDCGTPEEDASKSIKSFLSTINGVKKNTYFALAPEYDTFNGIIDIINSSP